MQLWVFAMCPALRGSTVSYAGDTHFPKHSLGYSLNFRSQSKKKKISVPCNARFTSVANNCTHTHSSRHQRPTISCHQKRILGTTCGVMFGRSCAFKCLCVWGTGGKES